MKFVFLVAILSFVSSVMVGPSASRCFAQSRGLESDEDLRQTITRLSQRLDEIEAADALEAKAKVAQAKAESSRPIQPTIHWTGQLQMDSYGFTQSDANRANFGDIDNGTAFRRARFGAYGDYGLSEYRIEMDYALAGRPSFLDVFAGVKEVPLLGSIRVGHFFEPFSFERITPNRFVIFLERSLADQAFTPARNSGVMVRNDFLDSQMTAAVGLFRSNSDNFGDDVGDRFESAITSRATGLLWFSDDDGTLDYFHVGSGLSFRGADQGRLRFATQPEARLGAVSTNNVPFFTDTGFFAANDSWLYGFEMAWVRGPSTFSGEFIGTSVDAIDQALRFSGGYVSATHFLTGESRPYQKSIGTFDRIVPKRNFIDPNGKAIGTGPGAWELTGRVSTVDLSDKNIAGGQLTDITIGVNWYLNEYLRWTFNAIHAMSDRNDIESSANIVGSRIGFDF